MIIIPKRFMHNLAGKFKRLLIIFLMVSISLSSIPCFAQDRAPDASTTTKAWSDIKSGFLERDKDNYKKGLSYIISGSSALVAGVFGERASSDPIDKGIYSLFQAIGVASVAFGAYKWKIEEDDRLFFNSIDSSPNIKLQDKLYLMDSYYKQRQLREKKERVIKAIAHGIVAALNIYGATNQSNGTIKNGLYFIGGVNLLACLSYSF